MLFESLAADAGAFHARSYLANGPHAEWCRNNWNENRKSIQFWLTVPTSPIDSRPAEEKRDEVVVVVDDEPVIAITLSQILIRHGFPTVWLTDPCSAADLFEKLPLKLLITDIDMPGISGVMLAALARKSHPNSPVLLFSARGTEYEPSNRMAALDLGIHIETKPVAVDTLINRVRCLCSPGRVLRDERVESGQKPQHRMPELARDS